MRAARKSSPRPRARPRPMGERLPPSPRRLPFDLVLFDLDGTLVDTAPDISDALNAALRDHGLPPVAESWVRDRIGNGTRTLAAQALGGKDGGTLDELLGTFHKHYAAHCGRRGRLYQDAAGSLALLRRAGVKLALLTNKEERFAQFVIQVHGLDGDFDLLVCGDTLPVKKPDAAVVKHALAYFDVTPSRALLVGDSDIDVRCARNAGIAVWAVPYGYNQGAPIAASRPDRIIRNLRVLADTAVLEPEPS
jgi:phosphoglycolate phosphatase